LLATFYWFYYSFKF